MKKITSVAIVALLVAVALVLTFCSKQDSGESKQILNQDAAMSPDDIVIMNKIVAFRDKIMYLKENPGYKSGETMSVEEAVWNLETLFNVSYGFPDKQYAKTNTDTAIVQLSLDGNGEVLFDDIVLKYDEIISMVTQFYYSCGFGDKGFLLLDLKQGETVNGQMEINLRAVTGEKDEGWEPFGEDDDWLYGYTLGRCDYSQDTTDAAEEIQKAVNSNKPLVSPPPGYMFVYVLDDVVVLDHDALTNYPAPENPPPVNYMDYLIFYATEAVGQFTPGVEDCLIPDEMNFHFEGEKIVIYQKLRAELNKPQNWVFMECNLVGKSITINDYLIYYHNNNLTYAFRYLVPIGIIDPPEEL